MERSKHSSGRRPEKRRQRSKKQRNRKGFKSSSQTKLNWKALTAPALLLLLVTLGGGTHVFVQGLVALVVGVFLLFKTPKVTLDRRLEIAVLCFCGVGLFSFLPVFFGMPDWRTTVTEQLAISLSPTVSSQFFVSLESFLLVLPALGAFYLMSGLTIEEDDRKQQLWFLAIFIGVLAVVVSVGSFLGYKYPLGDLAESFSYFHNRNQTALFFCMGGLIAFSLAMQGMRRARATSVWGLLLTLVIFIGILFSLSRAGIILFFIGCTAWFFFRLRSQQVPALFKFGVPVFIVGLCLIVTVGQNTLQRFVLWNKSESLTDGELRLPIYYDTLSMIQEHLFFGVGLGNFRYVFAQYRDQSLVYQSVIHPESDWFWVWSEMGTVGLVALLLVLFFTLKKVFPFYQEKITAPYRAAAFVGIIVFLIHGLIDVSGHRYGTLFLALFLLRLSLPEVQGEAKVLVPRFLMKSGGVALILLGLFFSVSSVGGLSLHSGLFVESVKHRANTNSGYLESKAALKDIDAVVDKRPMDWWGYAQRAQISLSQTNQEENALLDFRRARFLEPVSTPVVFLEGLAWLQYGKYEFAASAWREAIVRRDPNRKDLFRKMFERSIDFKRFSFYLSELTQLDPEFRHDYLMRMNEWQFHEEIQKDIKADPLLKDWDEKWKNNILTKWARGKKPESLIQHIEQYPEIVKNGWFFKAQAMATMGDFMQAVELAEPNVVKTKIPVIRQYEDRDLPELERAFVATPKDLLRGVALLRLQVEAESWERAMGTMKRLLILEEVPFYVHYWKGELHRRQGEYAEAWEAWCEYFKYRLKIQDYYAEQQKKLETDSATDKKRTDKNQSAEEFRDLRRLLYQDRE